MALNQIWQQDTPISAQHVIIFIELMKLRPLLQTFTYGIESNSQIPNNGFGRSGFGS